ncbi:hypothetical protein ACWDCL_28235 [Streptomyces sp. NPDC001009]
MLLVLIGALLLLGGAILGLFWDDLTGEHQEKSQRNSEGKVDADSGFIHASFESLAPDSYLPPYETYSATRLTSRQVEWIESGQYGDGVVKGGLKAAHFDRQYLPGEGRRDVGGAGQVYLAHLVSDSSATVTVTDIDAVNIKCGKSKMLAEVLTTSEGEMAIAGVAYELQEKLGTANGFISDAEDMNWGDEYFKHHTIALGGAASPQSLSVLGVARKGFNCTYDLRATFRTDDGEKHQKKLNEQHALTAEGGPAPGPDRQFLEVRPERMILWACNHGHREPEDCLGVKGYEPPSAGQ